MKPERREAYVFLLCAALWHTKLDLARAGLGGFGWWNPFAIRSHRKHFFRAWHRAFAFHNLALFLARDMAGFEEEKFWSDIEYFQERCPENDKNYRSLFDRKIAGESVDIYEYC